MVIKTESGMAMAAAASIDSIPDTGIMGCIAGDDTIIAVLKTTEDAQTACIRLRHDLRLD
jgi:transcriptional regulator of arginine metabolism